MSSMIALSREGHLAAVFQMFSFLKSKFNGVALFDPTGPEIDETQFPTEDCSATTYGPCREDSHYGSPASRGIGFTIRACVGSDNSSDPFTSLSMTGFILLLSLFKETGEL